MFIVEPAIEEATWLYFAGIDYVTGKSIGYIFVCVQARTYARTCVHVENNI
jgi:hypothetical protein